MTTFELKKIYNFNTLAVDILGNRYENMQVLATLTAEQAMKYSNIYTLHANLVPVISGLPTNPKDCTFLLLENRDNNKIVLAIEYIDPTTVELVTTVNIRVDILDANTNDLAIIRTRLKELGYVNIDITTY